ncbi:MAG: putative metallopeptidase [Candidatus Pacearchaeota archaeon]
MKRKTKIIYEEASDIKEKILEIINVLNLKHIQLDALACIRSKNARTSAIARCYSLSKPLQIAFKLSPRYVIEVVSEKFDKLSEEEKTKVLIHELLHIPKNFGGGFRHHDFVNSKSVERFYKKYKQSINLYSEIEKTAKDEN